MKLKIWGWAAFESMLYGFSLRLRFQVFDKSKFLTNPKVILKCIAEVLGVENFFSIFILDSGPKFVIIRQKKLHVASFMIFTWNTSVSCAVF